MYVILNVFVMAEAFCSWNNAFSFGVSMSFMVVSLCNESDFNTYCSADIVAHL